MPRLAGLFDDFRAKYESAVADYRAAGAALIEAENNLWAVADTAQQTPEDAAEWRTQMDRIIATQETLRSVENAVSSVRDFLSSLPGFFGLSGVKGKQLGLAFPAIPWGTLAIITGGAASVWIVIDGVNAFINALRRKAIDAANIERAQQGLPPLEYPLDLRAGGTGLTAGLQGVADIAKWLTIGAVVLAVLPALKKR